MKRIAVAVVCLALTAPALAQMQGMDMKSEQTKSTVHRATGVVTKVDAATGRITIKHDPVKSLNWPAMAMVFKAKDKAVLDKVKKGQKIDFGFVEQGKDYVVTDVR